MKILICITFHYNYERIEYLKKVLNGFVNIADKTTIYIITNTNNLNELNNIDLILPPQNNNFMIQIKSMNVKSTPYNLIACHKKFLVKEFMDSNEYTHFLHTEDDLLFKKENFEYWIEYRKILKKSGHLPSFFRIERKNNNDFYRSSDVGFKIFWFFAPKLKYKEYYFLNMPNPSQSNYLVDKELASEMIQDPPNTKKHFYLNSNIGIREKIDIGPIFSKVPTFYISRNLVPILINNYKINPDCFILHLPGNYAMNNNTNLGNIDICNLFYLFPLPTPTLLRNIKYYLYVQLRNFLIKFIN